MENNNEELINAVHELGIKMSEAMTPVIESLKKVMGAITERFLIVWDAVKDNLSFLDKNISRKRFIKLLMSIGYQRNEANKIAWNYHKENGKYTLLNFLTESRKKEDLENGMVRN